MINSIVKTYWEDQLKKRKYSVNINRLSEAKIKSWGPKINTETWRDLDPYSSLEDIGSTSDDNKDIVPDDSDNKPKIDSLQDSSGSASTPVDTGLTLRSRLRKRKLIRHSSGRPMRRASRGVEYDEGLSSPKRKIRKLWRVLPGPLQDRIAARHKRTIPPKTTHQIKINKCLKEETGQDIDHVNNASDHQNSPPSDNDSEDNIPLSELVKDKKDSPPKSDMTPSQKPRQRKVFVTKRIGLIKRKCIRTCKCPKCEKRFPNQGELNRHYRKYHDRVKCSKCPMTFSIPSTLTQHMYYHAEPRHFCHCGEGFRFLAEIRIHKLTHRRIKTAICQHPGCGKSYMSQSDLSKHAKVHEKVEWKCKLCDYTNYDKRLLKSHMRKHDQTVKYTCSRCGKGFVYHTQFKRHRTADNCTPLKRSGSPEL